jgi:hypothetical protein
MPHCLKCLQFTFGTNLCALCANTLPPNHKIWSRLAPEPEEDEWAYKPFVPVATVQKLTTLPQAADKVQEKSQSVLAENMDDWVIIMCRYLDSRGYWECQRETDLGEQHTPHGCEADTTSLDFQGVRAGSDNTFWIDLQGQSGGGSTKRFSYCQVMIQTCVGGPVSPDLICAALLQSLKGGKIRIVIYVEGKPGRPK